MQIAAKNNLFLTSFSSRKRLGDTAKLINNGENVQLVLLGLLKAVYEKQTLNELGAKLWSLADEAFSFRRMDTVEQVSRLLINLPLSNGYRGVGQYFQVVATGGQRTFGQSRALLENLIEEIPSHFKPRVMLAISASYYNEGDFQSALPAYGEAATATARNKVFDPFTFIQSHRTIAILKGIDGDRRGALSDLESLRPLAEQVRATYPQAYYDYQNSLAVELGEAGRLKEALNASRIAVASPYGAIYSQWRETQANLLMKSRGLSRSAVAVSQTAPAAQNVVTLPATQPSTSLAKYQPAIPQQARVLRFRNYLRLAKEVSEVAGGGAVIEAGAATQEARVEDLRRMTTRQKLLRIMDLMSDDTITDDQLLKILFVLEGLA